MPPLRRNRKPPAALALLGLCVALAACVPTGTGPVSEPARPPDPGYDAQTHLRAQYTDSPECRPRISAPEFVATLMAEPATCPASWSNPEPTPCTQIERPDGSREPVPAGIVGLQAAGSPPRLIRLARLAYDGPDHCLPTDYTPPGLIYLGQG